MALRTVREYLDAGKADPTKLQKVVFCVWSDKDRDVYRCARSLVHYFVTCPNFLILTFPHAKTFSRQLVPLYFPPSATDKDKDKEEVVGAVVDALVPAAADAGGVGGDAGGGSGDAGGGGGDGGGGGGGGD